MRQIKLTQGKFAIVDDDLYNELSKYNWCVTNQPSTSYAVRNENNATIRMHRQILNLKYGDGKIVDHINRNGLDNRKGNLRIVSKAINCRNHGGHSDNTSGYTGVSWHKGINKWQAQINSRDRFINLGYHSNIKDAIDARKQGEIKYWGEIGS